MYSKALPNRAGRHAYGFIPIGGFEVKNYWIEGVLEKEHTVLTWDLKRVQLLESLIKRTAQFGVELDGHFEHLSIFDYDSIVQDHLNGSCDPNRVKAWVYVSLLRKAVQDANAVALLRSKSLTSQALNLWRSLFETDVVCQYVGDRSLKDDHLTCRYAIHSIIRPTVRRWKEFNKICSRRGLPEYYTSEKINRMTDDYKKVIGEWRGDYKWTDKYNTFEEIAQAINSDMLFYRIANNEIHPTIGQAEVVSNTTLPLPAMPLLPIGILHDAGKLSLEFQTAKSLKNTTWRVTDYTTLTSHLHDSLTALKDLSEEVLQNLT